MEGENSCNLLQVYVVFLLPVVNNNMKEMVGNGWNNVAMCDLFMW
jgi:hypothetical protein